MIVLKRFFSEQQINFDILYYPSKGQFLIENSFFSSFFKGFSYFWNALENLKNNFIIKSFNFFIFLNKKVLNTFLSFLSLFFKHGIFFPFYKLLILKGLGFRMVYVEDDNVIRCDFGWSHVGYFNLPRDVFFLKKQHKYLIYSWHVNALGRFFKKLLFSYIRIPYQYKGVFGIWEFFKKKIGKQRQK